MQYMGFKVVLAHNLSLGFNGILARMSFMGFKL